MTKLPQKIQSTRAATLPPQHNVQIDILRGLAILGVIACHTIVYTDRALVNHGGAPSNYVNWLISFGKYGVEVFFFVSGYLMQSLYGREKEFIFRRFFARRFGRIYPLWVAFLLIDWSLLRNFGTGGAEAINLVRSQGQSQLFTNPVVVVLLSLTFTLFVSSNLWNTVVPGGWSIQAEMFHYCVFSIIRKFTRRATLLFLTFFATASLVLATMAKSIYFNSICPKWILALINAWVRLNVYSTLIYFMLGVCFFHLLNGGTKLFKVRRFDLVLLLLIGGSTLALPLAFGQNMEAMGYLFTTILLSYVIDGDSRIGKMIQKLGKFSYFMYFFQIPVLYFFYYFASKFKWHSPSNLIQIPLFVIVYLFTTCACVIVGKYSYKYFEKPILRFAHKI